MAYNGETWMSIVCHLKMHTVLITVRVISLFARWQHTTNNGKHTTEHTCTHLQTWTHKHSSKFYCKITLINRFKLYLIKTYSKTPNKHKQNKQNVNKNNVEYILGLHLVNVTWRHPTWHYNVTPGDREAVNIRAFQFGKKKFRFDSIRFSRLNRFFFSIRFDSAIW